MNDKVQLYIILFVSLAQMTVELPAVLILLEAGWTDMLFGWRIVISFRYVLTYEFVKLRYRSCFCHQLIIQSESFQLAFLRIILNVGQGVIHGLFGSTKVRITLVVITVIVGIDLGVGLFDDLLVPLDDRVALLLVLVVFIELFFSEFVQSRLLGHLDVLGFLLDDLVADLDEL
jgi:hypothetical protein